MKKKQRIRGCKEILFELWKNRVKSKRKICKLFNCSDKINKFIIWYLKLYSQFLLFHDAYLITKKMYTWKKVHNEFAPSIWSIMPGESFTHLNHS